MNKVGFISLIIFLIVLDLALVFRQFKMKEKAEETKEMIKDAQVTNMKLIQNLKTQIELGFNQSIYKINCLNSYSTTQDIVVLFIQDEVCYSCLNELLGYLDQLGDKIGKNRILLLGNFKLEEDFLEYVKLTSRFIKAHLNCKNIDLLKNLTGQPILFVLSPDKEIHFFYIPNYLPDFKEEYFTKLLPSYFDTKINRLLINQLQYEKNSNYHCNYYCWSKFSCC